MVYIRRKYFLIALGLLLSYFLISLLKSVIFTTSGLVETSSRRERKKNEIGLLLDIQDIYRLDISCEFITKHLSGKISDKYKNSKKCSLSSLDANLENKLKNSIVYNKDAKEYMPIFELTNFNIFNSDAKEYLTNFNSIQSGGEYQPNLKPNPPCDLNQIDFLAFVVPYMNRLENLNLLILNLHNYLTSNTNYQFSYVILVAEQSTNGYFNKGQIINTAVKYLNDNYKNVDCLILHDVDIIPIVNDSSIDYRCRQMPLHLTNQVLVMKSNWNRIYNQFLTGGILSLRPQHFISSNGFSNMFAGWGGEDDVFIFFELYKYN